MAEMAPRERRVPDLASRRGVDAVRTPPARVVVNVHLAARRIQAAIDAGLAGEPQRAVDVERGRVEVGARPIGRERERVDAFRRRIDADDRVQPAIRDPRRAVRSDDDAVRRRTAPERDLLDRSGRRVEMAEHARALARVPDAAVGGGVDVMRMRPRRDVELANRSSGGGRPGPLRGGRGAGWCGRFRRQDRRRADRRAACRQDRAERPRGELPGRRPSRHPASLLPVPRSGSGTRDRRCLLLVRQDDDRRDGSGDHDHGSRGYASTHRPLGRSDMMR
jgi:hypothetical protein